MGYSMPIPFLQQLKNLDGDDPLVITQLLELKQPSYTFPLGLTTPGSSDAGPFLELSCFEYKRSFRQASEGQSDKLYTVRLPFPIQGVTFGNQAYYVDFNALLGATDGSGDWENVLEQVKQGAATIGANALVNGATDILSAAAGMIPGVNISPDNIKNQASSILGLTFNPRLEKAFTGIGQRQYSFDYTIVPRNAAESKMIQDIIARLEDSMYPEPYDGLRVFLKYPDEFVAGFYNVDGTRMTAVPLIPDCFLSTFSYTVNSNTGTRVFEDGSPTSYRIAMTFVEANNLTRKEIQILRGGNRAGLGL